MLLKAKSDLSILLVEDYELDSDSIISQLEKAGYTRERIQVARSAQETKEFLKQSQPDVIILDLQVPPDSTSLLKNPDEDIRRSLHFLRERTGQVNEHEHIIVLSRFPTPWIVYQVMACGVSFIDKYNYKDLLPEAIELVQRGHVVISSNVRPNLRQIFPLSLRVGLDADDVRIIRCILEGLPDRDIGDRLGYSEEWVSGRLRKMFRSYGFHNREELANWFRDFVDPVIPFA